MQVIQIVVTLLIEMVGTEETWNHFVNVGTVKVYGSHVLLESSPFNKSQCHSHSSRLQSSIVSLMEPTSDVHTVYTARRWHLLISSNIIIDTNFLVSFQIFYCFINLLNKKQNFCKLLLLFRTSDTYPSSDISITSSLNRAVLHEKVPLSSHNHKLLPY